MVFPESLEEAIRRIGRVIMGVTDKIIYVYTNIMGEIGRCCKIINGAIWNEVF